MKNRVVKLLLSVILLGIIGAFIIVVLVSIKHDTKMNMNFKDYNFNSQKISIQQYDSSFDKGLKNIISNKKTSKLKL